MKEKSERLTYLPPQARDLSDLGVAGQSPEGYCASGPYPYYTCSVGPVYSSACTAGGNVDTSECVAGPIHTYPACKPGSGAVTGCLSGRGQNF